MELGAAVARAVKPGTVLALIGELGTGKTHFVKGFCQALGVKETVTSPTFVLLKQYSSPTARINHLDLYRVQGDLEALGFGFEDLLSPEAYTLIEWAERLTVLLPPQALILTISHDGEQTRTISLPDQLYTILRG